MKMEQTDRSETSAYNIHTPGNSPKHRIQLEKSFLSEATTQPLESTQHPMEGNSGSKGANTWNHTSTPQYVLPERYLKHRYICGYLQWCTSDPNRTRGAGDQTGQLTQSIMKINKNVRIRTVQHLDIIKDLFIHQLTH